MTGDPAIYKVLAVLQVVVWGPFFVRYLRMLIRNRAVKLHDLRLIFTSQSILVKLAGAVLMIGLAMVCYGVTTILRQFLGLDYWGRDAVRMLSSILFLIAGIVFHRVLSRESDRSVPNRPAGDIH